MQRVLSIAALVVTVSCEQRRAPDSVRTAYEVSVSGSSCIASFKDASHPPEQVQLPWRSGERSCCAGESFEAFLRVPVACDIDPMQLVCEIRIAGWPPKFAQVKRDGSRRNTVRGVMCDFRELHATAAEAAFPIADLDELRSEHRVVSIAAEAPDASVSRIVNMWRSTSSQSETSPRWLSESGRVRDVLRQVASQRPDVARAIRAEELRGR